MKGKHTTSTKGARVGLVDRARVRATTEAEIEAQAREDDDLEWTPEMLSRAHMVRPRKRSVTMRLDPDIIVFFERGGRGYQSRINAILRSYVNTMQTR